MKLTEYKDAFVGIEMNDENKRIMSDNVLQSAAVSKAKTINAPKSKRQPFGWKKSLVAGSLASILLFLAIFIPLLLRGGDGGDIKKEAILRAVREAQFTPDLKKLLPESVTAVSDAQAGVDSLSQSSNRAAISALNSSLTVQPSTSGLVKIDAEDLKKNHYSPQLFSQTMIDEENYFKFLTETSKRDKELAIYAVENCLSQGEWYVLRDNNSNVKLSEYTISTEDFLSFDFVYGPSNTPWKGLILAKYSASEDEVIEVLLHYIGKEPDISLKKRYVIYPDDVVEIFTDHDHNPKYFKETFNYLGVSYDSMPYLINKKDSEFFVIQNNVNFSTGSSEYGNYTMVEEKRVTVASYKKTGDDFEGLRMNNRYNTGFLWDEDKKQFFTNGDVLVGGDRAEVSFLIGNKEEYFRVSTQKYNGGRMTDKDREFQQAYEYLLYKDKKWFSAATSVIYDKHDFVWIDGALQDVYSDLQVLNLCFTHNNFDGIKNYYCDVNYTSYDTKFIELENGEFHDPATAPLFCGDNNYVTHDNGNYRCGIKIFIGDFDENGLWVGPTVAETQTMTYRPLGSTQSLEEFALSTIWLPDGITLDFAVDFAVLDKLPDITKELSLLGVTDIINNPLEILDKLNQGFILDKFISFDIDRKVVDSFDL